MSKLAIYETTILRIFSNGNYYPLYSLTNEATTISSLPNLDNLVYFGDAFLENASISVIDPQNTGYYAKNEKLEINEKNLFGSGIRGVFVMKDTPDTTKIKVHRSVYIFNSIVLQFFYNSVLAFNNYLTTGLDPFGTIRILNLLLSMISPPQYDSVGDQQFLELVGIDYILNFKTKWDSLRMSNEYMPAPISIFLSNFGYDSIASRILNYFSVILPDKFG